MGGSPEIGGAESPGQLAFMERNLTFLAEKLTLACAAVVACVVLPLIGVAVGVDFASMDMILVLGLVEAAGVLAAYVALTRIRVRVFDNGILGPWRSLRGPSFVPVSSFSGVEMTSSPSPSVRWICSVSTVGGKKVELTGRQFADLEGARLALIRFQERARHAS